MPRMTASDFQALSVISAFGTFFAISGLTVFITPLYISNLSARTNQLICTIGATIATIGLTMLFSAWQAIRYYKGKSSVVTMEVPKVPCFFAFVGLLLSFSGLMHLWQLNFQLLPISASKITAIILVPLGIWLAYTRIVGEVRYRRRISVNSPPPISGGF